jgi:maleylpyruvate isomerase
MLNAHPDCENFCFGHTPTLADICLIPQIYNAHKFEYPMDKHPTLQRIYEHCSTLQYFETAKPENQLDYQV